MSVARADFAGSSLHSSRVCRADFGALLHSHGVGGLMGFVSMAVSEARILAIALAERQLRCAVGSNDFWLGFVLSWYRNCHSSAQLWCGQALRHVRLVRDH